MEKLSVTYLSDALESQEGFVAPRYQSGQRSADALLDAGRVLLARRTFDGMTVGELCKEAGLTTGAFYRRFDGKQAFFLALQRLAMDDARRIVEKLLASLDEPVLKFSQHIHRTVEGFRAWHVSHCGVVRASIQRRDHKIDSWQPLKSLGLELFQELTRRTVARFPELSERPGAASRLGVGFQVANGTMVNASLNDPGPLRLENPVMADVLARMITLFVLDDAHAVGCVDAGGFAPVFPDAASH